MPLRIMSPREIAARQKEPGTKKKPEMSEYAKFIKKMKAGQTAHVSVTDEKVTRQAVKLRISKAAEAVGATVKFMRSGTDEVMFTRV